MHIINSEVSLFVGGEWLQVEADVNWQDYRNTEVTLRGPVTVRRQMESLRAGMDIQAVTHCTGTKRELETGSKLLSFVDIYHLNSWLTTLSPLCSDGEEMVSMYLSFKCTLVWASEVDD